MGKRKYNNTHKETDYTWSSQMRVATMPVICSPNFVTIPSMAAQPAAI